MNRIRSSLPRRWGLAERSGTSAAMSRGAEENKDYHDVIGTSENAKNAAYINDVLRKEGALFTRMFAEEHNSQGNYFWWFSGWNQGVGYYYNANPTLFGNLGKPY